MKEYTFCINADQIIDSVPDGEKLRITCSEDKQILSVEADRTDTHPLNTTEYRELTNKMRTFLDEHEFILYIHGFASRFKPESNKVKNLSKIFPVIGPDLDYTNHHDVIKDTLAWMSITLDIALVTGTSLGGYWAARNGSDCGIPFVAMNPAINPSKTLQKYIGDGISYNGEPYHLDKNIPGEYEEFSTDGCGLILIDKGDDLLEPAQTINKLTSHYNVITFDGGSHRFEHIEDALEDIRRFHWNS